VGNKLLKNRDVFTFTLPSPSSRFRLTIYNIQVAPSLKVTIPFNR